MKRENDWTADQVKQYPDRLVALCGLDPLLASRIREAGIHRILFGSDGGWTNFTPLRAQAAFHKLPLTREEFRVIDSNLPPYMPATNSVPVDGNP